MTGADTRALTMESSSRYLCTVPAGERIPLFVSYSHADTEWLDRLKLFLQPESVFELDIWDDSKIASGRTWFKEIERALDKARVAILLVTQNFIASPFIRDVELARLLERRRVAALPILWIPARESRFESTPLAHIQALIDPKTPLIAMPPAAQEQALKQIANRIIERCRETPARRRDRGEQTAPPCLTIRLARAQAGAEVTYHVQPQGQVAGPARVLITGSSPTDEQLFDALFPDHVLMHEVLRLVHEEAAEPGRYPLRVRISTSDPVWGCLGWRRAKWRGQLLRQCGWTFEVTTTTENTTDVAFRSPWKVAVLSHQDPSTEDHVQDLHQSLVGAVTSDRILLQRTTSLSELRSLLKSWHPNIVYVHGPASVAQAQMCFPWHGSGFSLADLYAALASEHPDVLFVNGVFNPGETVAVGAPQFIPVALVRVGKESARPGSEAASAIEWLVSVVRDGADPVAAICQGPENRDAALVMFTAYKEWNTAVELGGGGTAVGPIEMDRERQRALMGHLVRDLIKKQLTAAAVVCAEPGNRIELFSKQALTYISHTNAARTTPLSVRFPAVDQGMGTAFKEELRLRLETGPREDLKQAISRRTRAGLRGEPGLLWINWGVVAKTQPLRRADLVSWLEFCEWLSYECPANVRILNLIAIERDLMGIQHIAELVQENGDRLLCNNSFTYECLDPLGSVPRKELVNFLGNSSCPESMVYEMASLILRKTGGKYGETFAVIEEGMRSGWNSLKRRLEPAPSAGATRYRENL